MSSTWHAARAAAAAFPPLAARRVPLEAGAGAVLAGDAIAATDLPAQDTAAMDGWALAGAGPWHVVGEVLAGTDPGPLRAGTAVTIATGAALPPGCEGILRREHGVLDAGGRLTTTAPPLDDVRPAGRECRRGDVVLPAGARLTPAAVGLLAAAGCDDVLVRRARVALLVLGDELLDAGTPGGGRVRDALGPLLAAWLPALGAEIGRRVRVADTAPALREALDAAVPAADVVVTTGSTARGPVDHLHEVLRERGARLEVDGVQVRPGHPQLLAVLPSGTPLVGLPGNPLAAVSGLVTLLRPLLAALHAADPPEDDEEVITLLDDVSAGDEPRLVPVRQGRPVLWAGPAMLRGLAVADGMALIPAGGLAAGERVRVLRVP